MFAQRRYRIAQLFQHGESPMGAIMVRCPRTGHHIPTGIEMDAGQFKRAPVFFARAYCRFCDCEHEWFAKDAWVCDGTGANRATPSAALGQR